MSSPIIPYSTSNQIKQKQKQNVKPGPMERGHAGKHHARPNEPDARASLRSFSMTAIPIGA